ncbi:glycogen synthase [Paenibacillus baekrokdamisoli]|uniref:Glycogen synthase n=1 Tax=Paenibacillus baekrokdamisoli TaxID=1712516 RepID=A0A3G9IMX3_9BACL|nr:glycogen synthase GlgA [Paenibacillus baekrokdamisoli]MBB3067229.1 starch synthase [Paenibacillus baekrokdamisoli]BBH19582.1 glycogen synthase [Paenibacillus baekrokdamisoli]
MKLLFAASEAVPLVKTGGLADVVGSLPKALQARGAEVCVILPKYGVIPETWISRFETVATFMLRVGWRDQYCGLLKADIDGVVYYLIDNEYYFKRGGLYGYGDDAERFVFFSIAVAEALYHMDFRPDIIHCHDWQTGLIPFLLKTRYVHDPAARDIATVYTIHNLRYQGVFGKELMKDLLNAGDELFGMEGIEFYGAGSCMKGGLQYADKLTTVSPTYAEEIQTETYGEKLEGLLRSRSSDLVGIVNGIDIDSFDPMNDPALEIPYRGSLSRKRKNKLALQQELGLEQSEQIPLMGIVSRLVDQKGFDLVEAVLEQILQEGVQLVVLGSGDWHFEQLFRRVAEKRPNQVVAWFGFNDALARRIYAGSDMYLMPSQFEPCGLSQLIALRYRSVPIVRETGGLKDTVMAYNESTGEGNGFSFTNYNAHDLLFTVQRAVSFYRDEPTWQKIIANGAKDDCSWNKSAKSYMGLYSEILSNRKET